MNKSIRLVAILLCLFVFAFAGWQLWPILLEYRAGDSAYEELRRYVAVPEEQTPETETGAGTAEEIAESVSGAGSYDNILWPEVDFDSLYLTNSDVVGWIYQEGTVINYPVVQGTDNDYYLHRLFNGKANSMGTIFLDYRNTESFTDLHCILYGHHMKNGSMFQSITGYKKQSYYDEHPQMLLITPDSRYVIELFAGYVVEPTDDAWQVVFDGIGEYQQWLEDARARSTFQSHYIPDVYDQIITLSTCSYEFDDARYVLVGVMNEVS